MKKIVLAGLGTLVLSAVLIYGSVATPQACTMTVCCVKTSNVRGSGTGPKSVTFPCDSALLKTHLAHGDTYGPCPL